MTATVSNRQTAADSEMSPLCRRFVQRFHVEPPLTPDGLWRIADAEGKHVRKRFFTEKSADDYCEQLR